MCRRVRHRPPKTRAKLKSLGGKALKSVPIKKLLVATPDITTKELRAVLAKRGHAFGYSTLQRVFRRHGLTQDRGLQPSRRPSRRSEEPTGSV